MKRFAVLGLITLSVLVTGCLDLKNSPYADLSPFLSALVGGDGGSVAADTWTGGFIAFSQNTGQLLELESSASTWSTRTIQTLVSLSNHQLMTTGSGSKVLWAMDGVTTGALFQSTDRGQNWTQVNVPAAAGRLFGSFAVCGDKILGVIANGQNFDGFYSTDGGSNWSTTLNGGGCSTTCTLTIRYAACGNGTFYVGFNGAAPFMRFSIDPSGTWNDVTGFGFGLTANIAANNSTVVSGTQATSPQIAAGTTGAGAFASQTVDLPGGILRVGETGGKFVAASHNDGANQCRFCRSEAGWACNTVTCTGASGTWGFNSIAGNGTTVFAGGFNNPGTNTAIMFQSQDSGVSFSQVTLPSDSTSPNQIQSVIYYPTD